MSESLIIPIALRADLIVRIQLPCDLTQEEAEKIARVVIAYAPPPETPNAD